MGFPVPEGESFEENLLLDRGIVNRMRNRPDRRGREFELGLRISPGMSRGPVFNDRGEVIAVSTFVRYLQPGGQQGPILDSPSRFISSSRQHVAGWSTAIRNDSRATLELRPAARSSLVAAGDHCVSPVG
jgi:hypothetical protein